MRRLTVNQSKSCIRPIMDFFVESLEKSSSYPEWALQDEQDPLEFTGNCLGRSMSCKLVPVSSDWSTAFWDNSSTLVAAITLKAIVEFPQSDRGILFSKAPVFSCQRPSCLPNCLLLETGKNIWPKSLLPRTLISHRTKTNAKVCLQ